MKKSFLLCGSLLTVGAAHAADTTLTDAESTAGWDGAALINDAKAGAHAVSIAVPAGKAGGGAFSMRGAKLDFSNGGTIRFWYRLTGTGTTDLMFKLISPTFSNNIQTVWPIFPAQAADGQWRQAVIDLSKGGIKWGTTPETGNQYIYFRTNAAAGSNLKLNIDDVVFTPGEAQPTAPAGPKLAAGQKVLLSDAESTVGWDGGSLIKDAKAGQGAIRMAVPSGVGALTLNTSRAEANFDQAGELSFWYRFTGPGASNLMIKVQSYPYADGYQAVWEVAPRVPADGQWHLVTLDLASQFQKWGNTADTRARYILFRTDSTPGSNLTLDLDDISLRGKLYTAQVQRSRVQGKTLLTDITLTNASTQPITLDIEGTKVNMPGGGQTTVPVPVTLKADVLGKLQPLETAFQHIYVTANGDSSTQKELTAYFAPPLNLPPHPRLLLTNTDIPAVKARIAAHPPLKTLYENILKVADGQLAKPVAIPDRGGQWWHHYACKKDGARLQTASPTQHKCPVCGTIYSGWPYDDVVLTNIHAGYSKGIYYLGIAYRLTEERKYADRAREILLAYADKYLTYPEKDQNGKPGPNGGRIGTQKLDEAAWTIPAAQGTDLIWDVLSDTDKQQLETKLFRPLVEQIRKQKLGIHNIQNYQNSAVGLTGLLFNDPEFVADAVTSPFGYRQQIAKGVTDEGQWDEGAWGYHFYAMNAMVPLLEAGERCGLNLYKYEVNGKSFKRMLEGPLQLAMPNYDLPAFNDSNQVNILTESNLWEGGNGSLYELGLTHFKEPTFAGILSQLKRGSMEALLAGTIPLPAGNLQTNQSRNYPKSGYAVLQRGTGKDATWLCLKYGPHGGGHGHFDKLNFVSYSRGQVLGYDPGTASYGVPIQEEWYRSTLAHNTLTVDETNQKPATGSILEFVDQPNVAAALADAGPIYDGVKYRRATALFGTDVILVVDIAESTTDRTFDFAYHNAGKWDVAPTGSAVMVPTKPGYQHLKDVVAVNGPLPSITKGNVISNIAISSVQDAQIWAGTGVGSNATDRVPCIITRVRGKQSAVATVISLSGSNPAVKLAPSQSGYTATVEVDGKSYKMTVAPEAAQGKLSF